jgi:hypothetical protein
MLHAAAAVDFSNNASFNTPLTAVVAACCVRASFLLATIASFIFGASSNIILIWPQ